jgi:hypothetical protein
MPPAASHSWVLGACAREAALWAGVRTNQTFAGISAAWAHAGGDADESSVARSDETNRQQK